MRNRMLVPLALAGMGVTPAAQFSMAGPLPLFSQICGREEDRSGRCLVVEPPHYLRLSAGPQITIETGPGCSRQAISMSRKLAIYYSIHSRVVRILLR
jgi:hypothetical protein